MADEFKPGDRVDWLLADEFKSGDRVIWLQQFPGGWDYRWPVDSTVVRLGAKRVLIDAPLRTGGTKQIWVKPETLRRHDAKG